MFAVRTTACRAVIFPEHGPVWVQTTGQPEGCRADDYRMCDPWHYDTAGMVSLGERFAKAMRKLEEK